MFPIIRNLSPVTAYMAGSFEVQRKGMTITMYNLIARQQYLYSSLQDDLSRDIFWAKLRLDLSPSLTNAILVDSFCNGLDRREALALGEKLVADMKRLNRDKMKIVLHGTGATGQRVAPFILAEGLDFYAFCSRSGWRYPNGLLGKPAFSTEWLYEHADDDIFVLFLHPLFNEVLPGLKEHGFPMDHVLSYADAMTYTDSQKQYFEFPELFAKGTAFIDGGCYDEEDSIRFAQWCGNSYSKILAFEADSANAAICRKRLQDANIKDVDVIQGALSSKEGKERFVAKSTTGGFVVSKSNNEYDESLISEVPTVKIDTVAANIKTGMIKMDIEGAEYDALMGAAETIKRDKPLLAICIYHKSGDMLAIMDLCKRLVPEYRFWIRQYGVLTCETVLYAAV